MDVVTRAVYGLAKISWYGMASATAIYHKNQLPVHKTWKFMATTDRVVQGRDGKIGDSDGEDRVR